MQSIPGRFAATTVSAGAIALLLSLPLQRLDAEPSVAPARVDHLQSLLVEHDVRYALRDYPKRSTDCMGGEEERGQ
jgi:hypothetical protein